jgi:methylenetetrahydrofolate dehydrogenase (NADP+)/methenyltetrahydrofolate cyclohydrolase
MEKHYLKKSKKKLKLKLLNCRRKTHNSRTCCYFVGNDAASATYVASKAKSCKNAGIYSVVHEMPDSINSRRVT